MLYEVARSRWMVMQCDQHASGSKQKQQKQDFPMIVFLFAPPVDLVLHL